MLLLCILTGPKSFIGTVKYTDVDWPQDADDAKINANVSTRSGSAEIS